jgi:hypothetical protein
MLLLLGLLLSLALLILAHLLAIAIEWHIAGVVGIAVAGDAKLVLECPYGTVTDSMALVDRAAAEETAVAW